jgi:cytochrome P450
MLSLSDLGAPCLPVKVNNFAYRSIWLIILINEGEEWKHRRSVVNPLFNRKMLVHNAEVIGEKMTLLLEILPLDSSFNMFPYLRRFILDVVGKVALGIEFHSIENPSFQFTSKEDSNLKMNPIELFSNITEALMFRSIFSFKWLWYLPLPLFQKEKKSMKLLQELFGKVVDNHKTPSNAGNICL